MIDRSAAQSSSSARRGISFGASLGVAAISRAPERLGSSAYAPL